MWRRDLRNRDRDCQVWIPGEGPAWDEAKQLDLPCQAYDLERALGRAKVAAAIANWKLGSRLRRLGPGIDPRPPAAHLRVAAWALTLSRLIRVVHVQIEENDECLRLGVPSSSGTRGDLCTVPGRSGAKIPAFRSTRRVVAVPNAVDTERFSPGLKSETRQRLGVPAGRPLVLMLANLAPHKGQETAIEAIARLKQRGIDVTCWLAGTERDGEGHYTQRLRSLIVNSGVQDRVQLLGQRSDAPDLLRAADLFLLPSTHEGLPLSILEAQTTRVPVLAAPTPGVPEVVQDGQTGFLIAANDAEGYARRMEQLLANPNLYAAMTDAAFRRTTLEYNWSALCGRMATLYRELNETATPPRRSWFGCFGRK